MVWLKEKSTKWKPSGNHDFYDSNIELSCGLLFFASNKSNERRILSIKQRISHPIHQYDGHVLCTYQP
jgi:hypothetical protein